MEDFFILKKKVDKSVLFQGLTIPVSFQPVFYQKIGFTLKRGESVRIKISLSGSSYNVKLTNQSFNQENYPTRSDIVQIRYDGNTQLLESLRAIFSNTWNDLNEYRAENGTYAGFRILDDRSEYISVYASPASDELLFECISVDEYQKGIQEITAMDEIAFETLSDNTASISSVVGIKKIRHLSVGIGNSLKVLYGYRCQICGEYIGEKYGSNLIHAHHIDYFTKSLNNDSNNILVVCPNHHGIIHDKNPMFDKKKKEFEYPNGYKEGLKLNLHLNH